ncbi:nuclease harbi1-like protein [Caerostris darwini]|uniref:Nuclease harbi1-like protein n=1 Tax=Caerostris darwini TaxID=1538125 RepID=A0AAV4QTW1_9ARAC|nr:nuclease harbi1-like protein [Caerostris darwini]
MVVSLDSIISQAIEYKKINIPNGAALPSTKKVMSFIFVGDEAFALKKRPFPGNNLPKERRIFNYRLSRPRRCVENAFAAVCLHNFLKLADDNMPPLKRRYCPPGSSDTLSPDGDTILGSRR